MEPNFFQKLLALLVQILMLPVSALVQAFTCFTIWGIAEFVRAIFIGDGYDWLIGIIGIFMGLAFDSLLGRLVAIPYAKIMYWLKGLCFEGGWIAEKFGTVKRDIMDKFGDKIGSYETEGTYTESGMSGDEVAAIVRGALALPCRIVSILAAFVALFTNSFYVHIRETDDSFLHEKLHLWLDIIVP
ncbi:MAG: hypothetical protein IJ009_02665 [Clostridia bacterium]|nr:hypothetical protein [Clostridia bacterium]